GADDSRAVAPPCAPPPAPPARAERTGSPMARQAPAPCDTTANRERRNAPPPTYPSSENAGRSDRLNPSPAASRSGRERHAVGVYKSLCRVFCTTLLRSLKGGGEMRTPGPPKWQWHITTEDDERIRQSIAKPPSDGSSQKSPEKPGS